MWEDFLKNLLFAFLFLLLKNLYESMNKVVRLRQRVRFN